MIEIISEVCRFGIILGLVVLQMMDLGRLCNKYVNTIFVVSISILFMLEFAMALDQLHHITGFLVDANIPVQHVTMFKKLAQMSVLVSLIIHFYILKKDSINDSRIKQ